MNISKSIMGIAMCGAALAFSAVADEAKPGLAVHPAPAQKSAETAAQKIDQYINGDIGGIQNVKKNSNNHIISLVVIGRAPISSALTKARAKRHAFKRADADARAEFMKWLTTQVTYTYDDQGHVAIVQKGESLGDAGQGKAEEIGVESEFSQEQIAIVANGFVKGMVQIGAGVNADGEAVVILGWNADTADQMDEIRDRNTPKPPRKAVERNPVPANNSGATEILKKSTSVSDAANDFL